MGQGGSADNDGGTTGDYTGGQSGMSSEFGGGVGRDFNTDTSRDEGQDMGAGRDASGKRYMGGEGGTSSQEQSEENTGGR